MYGCITNECTGATSRPVTLKPLERRKGKTIMGVRVVFLLIGIVTTTVAVVGLIRGSVYCKGGPFSRTTQPVAFWASIMVYFFWSALMGYFVFFRHV